MDIGELFGFSFKNGASDFHLSAGMPPIIRVDGDTRKINVPPLDHKEVHNMVYDIMNGKQRKDYEEEFFELSSGDRIFAYTDGVSEWQNPAREIFDLPNLLSFLDKSRSHDIQDVPENLLKELQNHASGELCDDDLTVLMFEYLGNPVD